MPLLDLSHLGGKKVDLEQTMEKIYIELQEVLDEQHNGMDGQKFITKGNIEQILTDEVLVELLQAVLQKKSITDRKRSEYLKRINPSHRAVLALLVYRRRSRVLDTFKKMAN